MESLTVSLTEVGGVDRLFNSIRRISVRETPDFLNVRKIVVDSSGLTPSLSDSLTSANDIRQRS